MNDAGDGPREDVMGRLRSEIERRADQSESPDELERVVTARRDDLREIRMSCQLTGAYAHWVLTAAQGGTFIELAMGMQPKRLGDRILDVAIGRRYFRSWSAQSLAALREALRDGRAG